MRRTKPSHEFLEPGSLDGCLVRAIPEAGNAEQTIGIALTDAVHAGFGLGYCNRGVWHDRPGLIRDFAGYNTGVVLCKHGQCQQEGNDYQPYQSYTLTQFFSFWE